jgi:hypothetical protein
LNDLREVGVRGEGRFWRMFKQEIVPYLTALVKFKFVQVASFLSKSSPDIGHIGLKLQ